MELLSGPLSRIFMNRSARSRRPKTPAETAHKASLLLMQKSPSTKKTRRISKKGPKPWRKSAMRHVKLPLTQASMAERMGTAIAIFQIAIAMGSICLVTKKRPLWYLALAFASLATAQMIQVWLK